jgi:hypothetical protein
VYANIVLFSLHSFICIFSFSDDSDSSNEFKGKSSRVSITLSGCEYISTNPAKEVSY